MIGGKRFLNIEPIGRGGGFPTIPDISKILNPTVEYPINGDTQPNQPIGSGSTLAPGGRERLDLESLVQPYTTGVENLNLENMFQPQEYTGGSQGWTGVPIELDSGLTPQQKMDAEIERILADPSDPRYAATIAAIKGATGTGAPTADEIMQAYLSGSTDMRYDINKDGVITPADASGINVVDTGVVDAIDSAVTVVDTGAPTADEVMDAYLSGSPDMRFDINKDGVITPADASALTVGDAVIGDRPTLELPEFTPSDALFEPPPYTPYELTPYEEFEAPEYDPSQIRGRTQDIATPRTRRLQESLTQALSGTIENPNVRRMLERGALSGYSLGLEDIMGAARGQARGEYEQEYEELYDVTSREWETGMRDIQAQNIAGEQAAEINYRRDLTSYSQEIKMAEDARLIQYQTQLKEELANYNAALEEYFAQAERITTVTEG